MIKDVPVQGLTDRRKASEFVKERGIPIVQYPGKSHNELLKLSMQPIEPQRLTSCHPLTVQFTLLRHCCWFFGVSNCNWSGFMQNITEECSTQRKDQISFLPNTDLNPSDENCINSTLLYICDQTNR